MKANKKSPWAWIPTLYFAEGLPYILVVTLSVIMYKRLGISNTDITYYTGWLYLPWVIKPFWSPIVDMFKTKRIWILITQILIGAGMAGVAFTIPTSGFFQWTLAFFWIMAFSSATHDIAADGFYMLALDENKQSFFVGIRSTFYRFAVLTGQGLLIILAGYLESSTGLENKQINFSTQTEISKIEEFKPQSIKNKTGRQLEILLSNRKKSIGLNDVEAEDFNTIKSKIQAWNNQHNFYTTESINHTQSWWENNISNKLKHFLKDKFGEQNTNTIGSKIGNFNYFSFQLSKKPEADETVVINIDQNSGGGDFRLVEGSRFEFNSKNWNKPAYALIQIDPKLNEIKTGIFELKSGRINLAWTVIFFVCASLFILLYVYHRFSLPKPDSDIKTDRTSLTDFGMILKEFFTKKGIGVSIAFLLLYRLSESQLVKVASLFLIGSKQTGGLGLTTSEVGFVYGTVGMVSLTVGGILGGIVASKYGLKFWLWWMAVAINLPNVAYLFMSIYKPDSFITIASLVGVEQFGYGFGFTSYMLYMIYISKGKNKTTHFAISTGFMALGMMIPGMISGWIQEIIGYQNFFVWVLLCAIPIFFIIPMLKVDRKFGKKM
jgi:PAT family beta-lactamase induction signal transducer AmpG